MSSNTFKNNVAYKLFTYKLWVYIYIAMDLKLSKSTVEYMPKTNSERKKKRGRKTSIGKRTERRMKRTVTRLLTPGEKFTARKVKEKCELDVNVRIVQRTLHRIGLKYAKAKKKITLTKKHKGARLECAKRWLTKKVIFTDEKRFKFVGPMDGVLGRERVSLLY